MNTYHTSGNVIPTRLRGLSYPEEILRIPVPPFVKVLPSPVLSFPWDLAGSISALCYSAPGFTAARDSNSLLCLCSLLAAYLVPFSATPFISLEAQYSITVYYASSKCTGRGRR